MGQQGRYLHIVNARCCKVRRERGERGERERGERGRDERGREGVSGERREGREEREERGREERGGEVDARRIQCPQLAPHSP
jgi:hypothetical protein